MPEKRHCILVGMPGVGKITIAGRGQYPACTDFAFLPVLDVVIEIEIAAVPSGNGFEHQGEAAFRDIEARLLERERAAKAESPCAFVGGAPCCASWQRWWRCN